MSFEEGKPGVTICPFCVKILMHDDNPLILRIATSEEEEWALSHPDAGKLRVYRKMFIRARKVYRVLYWVNRIKYFFILRGK